MSVPSVPATLREFLKDLSAIREEKNVTLEEIQAATKVNAQIIAQFEEDGLREHPLFNELYVRAFVRGYAKTIGIPADEAAGLHDAARQGIYRRELAVQYLGLQQDDVPDDAPKAVRREPPSASEPVVDVAYEVDPSATSSRITWVAAEQPTPPDDVLTRIRNLLASILTKESAVIQWGVVAIGGGLGLLLILQLISSPRPESEVAPSVQPESTEEVRAIEEESLAIPIEENEGLAPLPVVPVALGDSLEVYVVAANGKLDPFRARVDEDLRRPYWLDAGDSMLFRMGSRIVIEDNLEAMKIILEGHPFPILRTDSLASVVITRDTVQAFLAVRQ